MIDEPRSSTAEDFTSLSLALVAWRKYAEHPNKVRAGTAAYEQMVTLHGQPTRIYIIQSNGYLAVAWADLGVALKLQPGFMHCRERLSDAWRKVERFDGDWWSFLFPDFEDHSSSDKSAIPDAMCPCSPGFLLPVGSECPYCGEVVG